MRGKNSKAGWEVSWVNNKVKDAFSEISAEKTLKQKTLRAIKERGGRKKNRSLGRMLGWAASAACVAAMLIVGGVLYTTQTAYISIDVNPSIELSLNRFDRVLKAVPKNEDARRVLSGIDLDHLKYSDALQKIVEAERALGYLDEGAAMVLPSRAMTTHSRAPSYRNRKPMPAIRSARSKRPVTP